MKLSDTQRKIILEGGDTLILNEGSELYNNENYDDAIEFYRLAAAKGSDQAICNLGYCYLYGRSVEKDTELAFSYFKTAAEKGNIEALYKLGTFFSTGTVVKEDKTKAKECYSRAMQILRDTGEEEEEYPSLFYTLAKEIIQDQSEEDYETAISCLKIAKYGYERLITRGQTYYQDNLDKVEELLSNQKNQEE